MSTISASTTSTTAYKVTADTTGTLVLQTGSSPTTAVYVDGSQNVSINTSTPLLTAAGRGNLTINGSSASIMTLGVAGTWFGYVYASGSVLDISSNNAPTTLTAGGANYVGFNTNGSERMRIDSSGSVGIGGTPNTFTNYSALQVGGRSSFVGNTSYAIFSQNWYYDGADKYIGAAAATQYYQGSGAHVWRRAASGSAGGAISWTDSMTLDSSGNLQVGGTPTYATRISANANGVTAATAASFNTTYSGDVSVPAVYITKYDSTNTTSQLFVRFVIGTNSASGSGQINANGASAAAFGSWSDRRLKENIVDLPSQLANIMALRPVEYDYIASEGGGHQIGFIAQEVQEIYPDLIGEREDGMLTLTDMNKNDARLIKAIQEQHAIIQSLTQRIEALESK